MHTYIVFYRDTIKVFVIKYHKSYNSPYLVFIWVGTFFLTARKRDKE